MIAIMKYMGWDEDQYYRASKPLLDEIAYRLLCEGFYTSQVQNKRAAERKRKELGNGY